MIESAVDDGVPTFEATSGVETIEFAEEGHDDEHGDEEGHKDEEGHD